MKFQYIFLVFFGLMAVIGVFVFSQPSKKTETKDGTEVIMGHVSVWGTYDDSPDLRDLINEFNKQYEGLVLSYQYHDPKTFDTDITEALAEGAGPDILLLPDDLVLRHSGKIKVIPYTTWDQRRFKDTFVDAAGIYLRPDGVLALPLAVDPLLLFWNKDMFADAGIAAPPRYWDELLTIVPRITKRDRDQNLTQSAIALGEYGNVHRAKDIIAMMFMQVGNPIIAYRNNRPTAVLTDHNNVGGATTGAQSALRYYVDFVNPKMPIYTWNRSRENSRDEFINGDLAMYFDTASAYKEIAMKNPHLNFDVAIVPQPRDAKFQSTGAKIYGLSILKTTKNSRAAYAAVDRLTNPLYAGMFASTYYLPPVRLDLLAKGVPGDAVLAVFYDSAVKGRSWLDPKPSETDDAFRVAVESISSGVDTVPQSISNLQQRLQALVKPYENILDPTP